MSHHQIYDFDDLELNKSQLNDEEYRAMWLCLNSRINPKSIKQHHTEFLQNFAKKLRDERKHFIKERVREANLELQKDLEELEKLIAENERREREEQEEREEREREKEREREHYNNTVWLGVEPMDLSDDMVEGLYDDCDDGDEDGDEENTKRIKFGGYGSGNNKTTIVDTAFFTLLFGLYMIGF